MTAVGLTSDEMIGAACQRWFADLSDRGIFTTDAALVVRTWNRWLEAQTGISAEHAIGRPLLELCPSIVERDLDQYFRDALGGEVRLLSERFHKYLIPIERHAPSAGLGEMAQTARIAPLVIDGTIVGTITVIDDVSERVVSERELRSQIATSERARATAEEASKLKDDFLATLSHEIRTPLNAVLGWTRILRIRNDRKSRQHALDVIERNAASQLRLVEDLLDMSRVMSGKLQLDIRSLSIVDIITAARDVVAPAAAAKGISITTTLDPQLPPIAGDADRLQQAIWNLLSNAVKFTERGGRVDIRTSIDGDAVEVRIVDSGEGISPEFLPYIFDRFRQADASASRRHGGLGLGLALVRHIVELHGGTVAAHSDGPHQGTTMVLRLPASPVLPREAREVSPKALTLKGIRVLVVDDDMDGRDMMSTALKEFGARVRAVASSRTALALLRKREFNPHILVADLGMPDVDGFELIRNVRILEAPEARALPAIAVTAYATPADRVRALAAGYQDHISKPIDPSVVAASIIGLVPRT